LSYRINTSLFLPMNLTAVKRQAMVCDFCGKEGARIRLAPRTYGKGKDLLVIENVPVISCPHGGESYLTAETLHELAHVKRQRRSLAQERLVAVAEYA
jgi:YgiT-type zinc finger domain-containing protein